MPENKSKGAINMDILKKVFPFSFNTKDVASLVIKIVVYVVVSAVLGIVGAVLSWIPLIGWVFGMIFGLIGGLVGLYCLIGIVLAILDFCNILK
jgi:hypothetical protein